ncbi:ArdC family protein [Vulcanococcus limneticus]|uniref:ArdC family protein n=1 Tax=Vulcanococcus limneticus TaxID=2170428 RepID=UPI000B99CB27|nr:ArdC family protein [Vulcanococcus limneticus]MCP9791497.1 DUF1738 domain-containing protein [Vulcanococcus limneticus MW73D5]MCP9898890.1 DUF1738 domain-containing protein [Vulcanococcus limneticus Candia 3B3]
MAAVSSPTTRRGATTRKRAGAAHTRKSTGPSPEDKLVAALVCLLEQGTTPWRRPWDSTGGGHHVNLLSGHRYRGANPILLTLGMHLRGSALPYCCGYAGIKAAGLTLGFAVSIRIMAMLALEMPVPSR